MKGALWFVLMRGHCGVAAKRGTHYPVADLFFHKEKQNKESFKSEQPALVLNFFQTGLLVVCSAAHL